MRSFSCSSLHRLVVPSSSAVHKVAMADLSTSLMPCRLCAACYTERLDTVQHSIVYNLRLCRFKFGTQFVWRSGNHVCELRRCRPITQCSVSTAVGPSQVLITQGRRNMYYLVITTQTLHNSAACGFHPKPKTLHFAQNTLWQTLSAP